MRRFNRYSLCAAAVSLWLLFGVFAVEAHPHGAGGELVLGRLLKGLDLSDQQRQQVKEIMEGHRSDLVAGKIAVLQARQYLLAATTGGSFDPAVVQKAYTAVSAAQEKMTIIRARIFSEVLPVLTAGQQAVVKEKIAHDHAQMQCTIDNLQSKESLSRPGL